MNQEYMKTCRTLNQPNCDLIPDLILNDRPAIKENDYILLTTSIKKMDSNQLLV